MLYKQPNSVCVCARARASVCFVCRVIGAVTQRSIAASNPALETGMHLVEIQGEDVRHYPYTATKKRIEQRNLDQTFILGFARET